MPQIRSLVSDNAETSSSKSTRENMHRYFVAIPAFLLYQLLQLGMTTKTWLEHHAAACVLHWLYASQWLMMIMIIIIINFLQFLSLNNESICLSKVYYMETLKQLQFKCIFTKLASIISDDICYFQKESSNTK